MIRSEDFRILRVQAAAFFSGEGVRPAMMLRHIPEDWFSVYDADPVSLPVPLDAPEGVPGLILQSRDQRQSVRIARTRIDLVRSCENEAVVDLAGALETLSRRLAAFSESSGTVYGRLAAVVSRIAEEQEPGRSLVQQFCRDEWLCGPLNRPEGFELHAHKVFSLVRGVPVNSWMRIKTARTGLGPYDHVLVEQDINTLMEELETRKFDETQIASWFRETSSQLDFVLRLYFP